MMASTLERIQRLVWAIRMALVTSIGIILGLVLVSMVLETGRTIR